MSAFDMQDKAEWLSQTFDWDIEQAAEFVRDVAAEAFDQAVEAVTELPWDHTAEQYPNPYRGDS